MPYAERLGLVFSEGLPPRNFLARLVALHKWCDIQMSVWRFVHLYIPTYRQQDSRNSPCTHAIQSSRLHGIRNDSAHLRF